MTYLAHVFRDNLYLLQYDWRHVHLRISDGHSVIGHFDIPDGKSVVVHYWMNDYGDFCMNFSWWEAQHCRRVTQTYLSDNRFVLSSVPYKHYSHNPAKPWKSHWVKRAPGKFLLR